MRLYQVVSAVFFTALFCVSVPALAAKAVDLRGQPMPILKEFFTSASTLTLISNQIDFTQTAHVRFRQTYQGYPVLGGDAVLHVPHADRLHTVRELRDVIADKNHLATMNGVIYQDLDADLSRAPAYVFNATQADKALQQAIYLHQQKSHMKNVLTD